MNFLIKLEAAINLFLLNIGKRLWGLIPEGVFTFLGIFKIKLLSCFLVFKNLPAYVKRNFAGWIASTMSFPKTVNLKSKIFECYQFALSKYLSNKPSGSRKIKAIFQTPIVLLSLWLKGLSAGQSLLLLTFSSASFLAVIGVSSSGQKLATHHFLEGRSPANAEEEVEYDRPGYYKEEIRHLTITNFRLPVYISEINELRSIDIDFTATMSNRKSRVFLEKQEFQLRDHLILFIEPVVASFPLEEEGKEILRNKIQEEINAYLISQGGEGSVTDIKLTYVLAN